ncbi:hypothetical protein TIFTF001_001444 [Ficus carica]|uniref:F-box domain-containing protein n=1 Tax=Ficus carica TaxID=3494 RepID=A0AA87Z009_FICCA|nr:hypothetical protein TIFTF001_001444 [Ficus carica]
MVRTPTSTQPPPTPAQLDPPLPKSRLARNRSHRSTSQQSGNLPSPPFDTRRQSWVKPCPPLDLPNLVAVAPPRPSPSLVIGHLGETLCQLPQNLIHRILDFLPTRTAARTTVLSKSWKSAWDSRSTVVLDIDKLKSDKLLQIMNTTLERYAHLRLQVKDLTLSLQTPFPRDVIEYQIFDLTKQCIEFVFAAGNNLRQLKVSHSRDFAVNLHPSNTLTTLYLSECKFGNISENIKFPSLEKLFLIRISSLTSDIIHKTFLSGSPLLKCLSLFLCHGLESLKVSGLAGIKIISVDTCKSLKRVDIQAPNLQAVSVSGSSISEWPEITLAGCDESLKQLKLSSIKLPNHDWLQTMVSRFVSLQILYLSYLWITHIEISSPSLRKLVIKDCRSFSRDSVINAPNLRFVEFMDNSYPFYSLPKSNKLSQVKFSYSPLSNQPVNDLWMQMLEEYLFSKTKHFKDVRMTVVNCRKVSLIFHKDFNYLLFCNIVRNLHKDPNLNKRLLFTINKPSLSGKDMVNCLFREWRPWDIYIASSSVLKTKFIKEFTENVHRWRKTVRCCQNRRKRWKHTLEHAFKDLQIERLNLEQDISNIGGQNSIHNTF